MKKSYLLLAVLAFNGVVHAEENPYMPEAKLKGAKDVATWNIGAGFTKKLLHANLEWVNPYGIAYAKVGAFLNDDNESFYDHLDDENKQYFSRKYPTSVYNAISHWYKKSFTEFLKDYNIKNNE